MVWRHSLLRWQKISLCLLVFIRKNMTGTAICNAAALFATQTKVSWISSHLPFFHFFFHGMLFPIGNSYFQIWGTLFMVIMWYHALKFESKQADSVWSPILLNAQYVEPYTIPTFSITSIAWETGEIVHKYSSVLWLESTPWIQCVFDQGSSTSLLPSAVRRKMNWSALQKYVLQTSYGKMGKTRVIWHA